MIVITLCGHGQAPPHPLRRGTASLPRWHLSAEDRGAWRGDSRWRPLIGTAAAEDRSVIQVAPGDQRDLVHLAGRPDLARIARQHVPLDVRAELERPRSPGRCRPRPIGTEAFSLSGRRLPHCLERRLASSPLTPRRCARSSPCWWADYGQGRWPPPAAARSRRNSRIRISPDGTAPWPRGWP